MGKNGSQQEEGVGMMKVWTSGFRYCAQMIVNTRVKELLDLNQSAKTGFSRWTYVKHYAQMRTENFHSDEKKK